MCVCWHRGDVKSRRYDVVFLLASCRCLDDVQMTLLRCCMLAAVVAVVTTLYVCSTRGEVKMILLLRRCVLSGVVATVTVFLRSVFARVVRCLDNVVSTLGNH